MLETLEKGKGIDKKRKRCAQAKEEDKIKTSRYNRKCSFAETKMWITLLMEERNILVEGRRKIMHLLIKGRMEHFIGKGKFTKE